MDEQVSFRTIKIRGRQDQDGEWKLRFFAAEGESLGNFSSLTGEKVVDILVTPLLPRVSGVPDPIVAFQGTLFGRNQDVKGNWVVTVYAWEAQTLYIDEIFTNRLDWDCLVVIAPNEEDDD